jgi:hypothetical protein
LAAQQALSSLFLILAPGFAGKIKMTSQRTPFIFEMKVRKDAQKFCCR